MFDRHHGVWPANLPLHLVLPQTSLYSNLAISALRYPDRAAMIYYDSPISYRRLDAEVQALAGYLQHRGVAKGDRVLLFMQNAPQFVIAYYAILRANAVVVPVNPMNRSVELEHYAEDTGATICICGQERFEAVTPLLESGRLEHAVVASYGDYVTEDTDLDLPAEVQAAAQPIDCGDAIHWSQALHAGHAPGELEVGPDDLAVLPYSSGTTGAPKGCMHTHATVMATAVQSVYWSHSTSEGKSLATLPYFHVTGMQNGMNAPIFIGSTVVLMTRWERRTAAKLIERYRITRWTNIVTMAIDMLADPEIESFDLSSLQNIGGGGAAMPEAVSEKLFKLTGLHYVEGYGLSETIAGTHINPFDAPKPQCLGIPVFDVDSRIVDTDTLAELGPNEVGEIITRGPQVFSGYWRRPEATKAAFMALDGERFFRTGDIGYYDDEGYFFLVDRVKRMINASGYKVWPAEVESLMYRHPDIREACVISTPHERRGEGVKACVVLVDGAAGRVSGEDIRDWCKDNMAAYKVPQVVEICDSLPRSPTGKIMWRALQEQEWPEAKAG
ncbi:long-chain fatty acid--CoA ligase [Salinisphaera aquimarina]|uniref:Long-chain fatty acid--CoA ligase n=1 Tax=Salinisphaera aquimarina TaxID=2094031 RepID=A0ABV7EVW3_9GAMM